MADVCIAVSDDGLKGLPDAINSVWELTTVQACIIDVIRNSFRYASRKYWDQVAQTDGLVHRRHGVCGSGSVRRVHR